MSDQQKKTPKEIANEIINKSIGSDVDMYLAADLIEQAIETERAEAFFWNRACIEERIISLSRLTENVRFQKEIDEQCRLNGLGGNREHKLMTENDTLREEVRKIDLICIAERVEREKLREENATLRHEFKMLQSDADRIREENKQLKIVAQFPQSKMEALLKEENARLHAALTKIKDGGVPDGVVANTAQRMTAMCDTAAQAMAQTLETERHLKIRNAERAVVEACREHFNHFKDPRCNCVVCISIRTLDQLQKESE